MRFLPAPRILGPSALVLEISPLPAEITQGSEGTRETACLWDLQREVFLWQWVAPCQGLQTSLLIRITRGSLKMQIP